MDQRLAPIDNGAGRRIYGWSVDLAALRRLDPAAAVFPRNGLSPQASSFKLRSNLCPSTKHSYIPTISTSRRSLLSHHLAADEVHIIHREPSSRSGAFDTIRESCDPLRVDKAYAEEHERRVLLSFDPTRSSSNALNNHLREGTATVSASSCKPHLLSDENCLDAVYTPFSPSRYYFINSYFEHCCKDTYAELREELALSNKLFASFRSVMESKHTRLTSKGRLVQRQGLAGMLLFDNESKDKPWTRGNYKSGCGFLVGALWISKKAAVMERRGKKANICDSMPVLAALPAGMVTQPSPVLDPSPSSVSPMVAENLEEGLDGFSIGEGDTSPRPSESLANSGLRPATPFAFSSSLPAGPSSLLWSNELFSQPAITDRPVTGGSSDLALLPDVFEDSIASEYSKSPPSSEAGSDDESSIFTSDQTPPTLSSASSSSGDGEEEGVVTISDSASELAVTTSAEPLVSAAGGELASSGLRTVGSPAIELGNLGEMDWSEEVGMESFSSDNW